MHLWNASSELTPESSINRNAVWCPQLSVYASVSEYITINYVFENVCLFVQWNVFLQLLRIKNFFLKTPANGVGIYEESFV